MKLGRMRSQRTSMIEHIWLLLNLREKALLLDALSSTRAAGQAGSDESA